MAIILQSFSSAVRSGSTSRGPPPHDPAKDDALVACLKEDRQTEKIEHEIQVTLERSDDGRASWLTLAAPASNFPLVLVGGLVYIHGGALDMLWSLARNRQFPYAVRFFSSLRITSRIDDASIL